MLSWTIALCAQVTLLGADATYADAHRVTTETGKPLVVMVGTDWCVPCQQMKRTVLPQVREHGVLGKVAFATVNADQDADLARQLTGGGPVPQLVMFRHTRQGWIRRKLIGGQSVATVEQFIKESVTQNDEEAAQEDSKPPEAPKGDKRT